MKQSPPKKNKQPIFRWTIARKISSLASVLIFLILIVIIYSIVALKGIRADLQEIARLDVPLSEIANAIEIHQLEQQISLDELLRISRPNNNTSREAKIIIQNKILTDKTQLAEEIERGIILSEQGFNLDYQAKFKEINRSLLVLKKEHELLNTSTSEIIQILKNNNYPDNQTIELLLIKNENFDKSAIALINSIQNFTQRRLIMAEKHEQIFFVVNISLGVAAISLGILLSLIIIINIKTNLFNLSKQVSEARQAISDKKSLLPTTTNINSTDEIGDLAAEISQTIHNFSQEINERDRISENLKQIATTDKLTGAFNRLKWDEDLERTIDLSKQNNQNLSIIIFDIDFFKKVNDTYGHDVGDMVLIEVVNVTQKQIRGTDSLYRIGGEEFVILATQTNREQILFLAERIRKAVEQNIFKEVERITISMGVTQLQDSDDPQQLVKRADLALYQSKKGGRNQVNGY